MKLCEIVYHMNGAEIETVKQTIVKKIADKFGFKAGVHFFTLVKTEGGVLTVYVQLKKPSDVKQEELLCPLISNYLLKNLDELKLRNLKVRTGKTSYSPSKRAAELEFVLSWDHETS